MNHTMVASVAVASFILAFSFVSMLKAQDSVIEISEEAVFITGEACVVNVGNRELKDILSDLNRCADLAQGIE